MNGLDVNLDGDGTWLCRHVAHSGESAPPTRLRLDQTRECNPGSPTSAPRRWIDCPDCGSYWRVWTRLGIAKPSAECYPAENPSSTPRYRRAPVLDIDRVIDVVKSHLPVIRVTQHHDVWPADDEGVWSFRLEDTETDIQLESSTGMCPFCVEHSGMNASAEAWNAPTVKEAARMVVRYLGSEVTIHDSAAG